MPKAIRILRGWTAVNVIDDSLIVEVHCAACPIGRQGCLDTTMDPATCKHFAGATGSGHIHCTFRETKTWENENA